ncbi:MAG: VCBS repeat-containing protein, partial [Phycisphaerales bacterium]|nr:VCBS repeat-containing protein [Phycisphaerales bacterium]
MRHSKSLVGPGTVMQELEARRLLDAAPTDVGDPPTALWTGGSGVVLEQQRTADLNGDGYADIVAVQRRRLLTFLNRGDGTFGEPTVTRLAGFVGKIGVGRFDGSGNVGVASAGTWSRPGQAAVQVLRLLRFDSASGGLTVVDRKTLGIGEVAAVEAANLVDDGRDEIVVLSRAAAGDTSVLTVRVTNAGSLFSVRTTSGLVGPGAAQLLVRGSVTAITFSNVSGDGRAEMIVGSLSDGLAVVRVYSAAAPRQADAIRFRSSVPFASGSNVVRSLSAADVTGDGRVDLVLGLGRMGDEGLPRAASEIVARTGLAVVPREDGGWGRAVDTGVDFGDELVGSEGLTSVSVEADTLAVVALGDLDNTDGVEALVVRRTAYV